MYICLSVRVFLNGKMILLSQWYCSLLSGPEEEDEEEEEEEEDDDAVGGKLKDKPSVPQSSERGLYKRKEKCKKLQ